MFCDDFWSILTFVNVIRVFSLAAIAIGVGATFVAPTNTSVLPVPGNGRMVSFTVAVASEADYRAFIATPTAAGQPNLGEMHIGCALGISVKQQNRSPIDQRTQTFSRYGQTFFMHLDLLKSDSIWHLDKGNVLVQVFGTADCGEVLSQGGTLTFEEDESHPTEVYLSSQLKFWGSRILAALGLVTLITLDSPAKRTRRKNQS
jgi:hypothetical protein